MRFGFFGGTQPNKGLSDVLDAASALRDAGLPFGLWLYGPGDCRAEVERRGLGDHVRLGGLRDPDDMAEAYDAIDVAVMASRVPEPLGRIPLEAASSGAPSIVPAIGGLPETIADGENGLLFRFRDVPDLARQMRRVIEDTGLMARLLGGVRPPTCADEGVAAVERFYYEVLGRTVVPASLPHGDPAATP
jgi:glycosyltransferase involved in cell wall biosynthesis